MKKQHKQPKHINAKRNNKKLCENHFDDNHKNEYIIEVNNLNKTFEKKIKGKGKGIKGFFNPTIETFNAVNDISFNIKKGGKIL